MLNVTIENALFFKLNYSGEIEEFPEKCNDPVELFSSVNIIPIYIRGSKKLFTWVGNNASQTLKKYISQFRELFSKKRDDLRVLRYITVEAKSEPYDFFQSTGISKDKLLKRLDEQENKLKPVVSKINELKQEEDELFEVEKYEQAVTKAEEILILAEQIEDSSLKQDQEEFISEARNRVEAKKIFGEITQETKDIKIKLDQVSNGNEIIEIHNRTEIFKEKYKKYVNLIALPDVAEILTAEDKVWQKYEASNEQLSQLDELEKNFNTSLEGNDLKRSKEVIEKIKALLTCSYDNDLKNKWIEHEKALNKKIEKWECHILSLEESIQKAANSSNLTEVVRIGEALLVIGRNNKREDLITKYEPIIKDAKEKLEQEVFTKHASEEKLKQKAKALENAGIDIDKYRKEGLSSLNKDNLTECYNAFEKVVEILKECSKK